MSTVPDGYIEDEYNICFTLRDLSKAYYMTYAAGGNVGLRWPTAPPQAANQL